MNKLSEISIERPLGSSSNNSICEIIKKDAMQMGYEVSSLPFDCLHWERGNSYTEIKRKKNKIYSSPYSKSFIGQGELVKVQTLNELKDKDIADKIVLMYGEITKEPLMPKDFPFYYPDTHKEIIDRLEDQEPKAIIALTGKHPTCGLNPFPLFEDGSFSIPSAYIGVTEGVSMIKKTGILNIKIDSNTSKANGQQIIVSNKTSKKRNKIVICAHMDTKYGTAGAIDNASGIVTMYQIMENLRNMIPDYDIDFVPFNGEEYFGVNGQLEYLNFNDKQNDLVRLVINIDSPGHKDSKTAVSLYNFNNKMQEWIEFKMKKTDGVVKGKEWYAGDHAMFAFRGIPCMAITSSNLFDKVLDLTHTQNDTIDNIDIKILKNTSDFITQIIKTYGD